MTDTTLPHRPGGLSSKGSIDRQFIRPHARALEERLRRSETGRPGALAAIPTDDLIGECHRRGLVVLPPDRPRVLPDLVVYPGGQVAVWRGREYLFTPTAGRVLCALAAIWPGTILALPLTRAVWGRYSHDNLGRVYVRYLRQVAPGLIETIQGGGYRLNLEAER
jgi:DNA-binding response OmpR family regulator